jgi:hypothetical protein
MNRPMVRIHNTDTNEIIDREMNNTEFAQYEIDQADYLVRQTEAATKIAQRQALLERLNITEDEARLLLG